MYPTYSPFTNFQGHPGWSLKGTLVIPFFSLGVGGDAPKTPQLFWGGISPVWFFRVFQKERWWPLSIPRSCRVHIQKKHRSEQKQQNLCATFLEHRGWFIGNPKSWLCIILIEVAIVCYRMLLYAIVCYCNKRVCNTVSSGIWCLGGSWPNTSWVITLYT